MEGRPSLPTDDRLSQFATSDDDRRGAGENPKGGAVSFSADTPLEEKFTPCVAPSIEQIG